MSSSASTSSITSASPAQFNRSGSSLSTVSSLNGGSSGNLDREIAIRDDAINKLKQTNATLRLKLKEFSVALDKSIHSASHGQIAMGAVAANAKFGAANNNNADDIQGLIKSSRIGDNQSPSTFLNTIFLDAVLQSEIRNMHKKLEIYRKNNEQLRKQLEQVGNADHAMALENALAEKSQYIEQLTAELKTVKKVGFEST
jgi:hypothetical protein